MNIKPWLLGNQSINEKLGVQQNPYLEGASGQQAWNGAYGNMRNTTKLWQRAFFCSLLMSTVFSIVIVKMATQSRVQPFIVETNKGSVMAVKSTAATSPHDERLINFALNQFIINAKTILKDNEAEKTLLNKVYAYSANSTINYLHEYYKKNNPFDKNSEYSITVDIVNSLPISRNTRQITWDETKRNQSDGNIVDVTRWMANLTYKLGTVNPQFIMDNPFGFYVTEVSWSQSRTE